MPDHTRVAELLREIEHRSDTPLLDAIHSRAREALRALGDEAEVEEWEAKPDGYGTWYVYDRHARPDQVAIAHDMNKANAHRLAALPRLERAAREVVEARRDELSYCHVVSMPTPLLRNLRAALDDQPGGQP